MLTHLTVKMCQNLRTGFHLAFFKERRRLACVSQRLWELHVQVGHRTGQKGLARKAEEGVYFQVEVRNSFVLQLVLLVSVRHHCNFTFKYFAEPKQMSCSEKQKEANGNWNYSGIKGEHDLGRAKWHF